VKETKEILHKPLKSFIIEGTELHKVQNVQGDLGFGIYLVGGLVFTLRELFCRSILQLASFHFSPIHPISVPTDKFGLDVDNVGSKLGLRETGQRQHHDGMLFIHL